MPFIHANGIEQYYRLEGRDNRPVVILSHSLGCDHSMWDLQADALLEHFTTLRYDTRGHGATDAPAGDYSMDMLGTDALQLLDTLGIERFAWCGLSMGGMIGQWIAAQTPKRVTKLVLANTSPRMSDPNMMETRRKSVLDGGMSTVADAVMGRFFTPESIASNSPRVEAIRRVVLATDPVGYAGCCAAVRDLDHRDLLSSIRCPTLIVAGDRDQSTPWTGHGEVLASEIAQTQKLILPTAHLSNLEKPHSFNAALFKFLLEQPDDSLAQGFEKRRAILGDDYVDGAIASVTDFTRTYQELITRYAWGTVWQRPGLNDRTRRLLVLGITAALGRWEEFQLHLSTGMARELEACDVEELLLQVAIYAGVPAANTGFKFASKFAKQDD